MPSETLQPSPPTPALLLSIGWVNHSWAQLDAIISAVYVSTLNLDPVEAGITIGRIETRAKVEKLKKIYRHRKNKRAESIFTAISKTLDKERNLRNALTHGNYMGQTKKGEYIWIILPAFIVDDSFSGNEMFVSDDDKIMEHSKIIISLCGQLLEIFDPKEMRKLFDLPSRVRK
ncbi:MAG: hypothetical protein OEL78_01975 [Hyphomicrobiales bacterium]|nr:hypothetical protein [Hyphomicrobiales bacterium]